MTSLSDPFIRRPVLAIVANLVLAVLGLFALTRLPMRELPRFEVPLVSVVTTYAGASAQQIERQVTMPIEQAIASVSGVDVLSSTSAPGVSTVQVSFTADAAPVEAANQVRAKIGAILNQLPRDADAPVVAQLSADAAPVLYLSLASATLSAMEVTDIAKRLIRPRLSTLPGVADVQVLGERRYAIRIGLDPMLLAARGVTPAEVASTLQTQNVELPSGDLELGGRRTPLIARTALELPEQFEALVLRAGEDWALQIGDVGQARVGPQDETTGVLIDGKNAVALAVLRLGGANQLDVARAVHAALPAVQAALPAGVELGVVFDSSVFIERSVRGVFDAILQAVGLVTAVILVFLASARAAFVTLVTIPLSLVGTLAFLLVMGYSLNTFTLLAMVLAVGLVVDDAIIDVENVQRHIRQGLSPVDAAFVGSREIGFAILATTATLAAVFAPIGLMPGLLGSLFREFAFTLAAAVIISGYISRTLSPMMCSRLLRAQEGRLARRAGAAFDRAAAGYGRLLGGLLRRRWLLLPIAAALAVAGVLAARQLPAELAPVEDPGYVLVRFQGPPGASYATMEAQARAISAVFESMPERQTSLVLIGTPSGNEGLAFLVLRPWEERRRSAQDIGRAIAPALAGIPGAATSVVNPDPLTGGGQAPVQFVVKTTGRVEQLAEVMDQLVARARANPDLLDPRSDLTLSVPQVQVEIDRALAADLKVPVSVVGDTLATVLGDRYVTRFAWGEDLHYVILELDAASRGRRDVLDQLFVRATDGRAVPLGALVRAVETAGPDALRHFGQLPAARLSATLAPGASLGSALDWLEEVAREMLPPGFTYDFDGMSRQAKQADIQVGLVFVLALVFIVMFLAAQFESFRDPLIVLAAVPFALVGALIGLAAVGGSVNIYSVIGIITLVGLVAKNGILVTEFVNQRRDEAPGLDRREAVRRGAALRLRPILMTSTATALGALPLVLAGGPGAVARNQIGAVIIGGMLFGTVVALVVVPIVYSLISRRMRKPLVTPPPLALHAAGRAEGPLVATSSSRYAESSREFERAWAAELTEPDGE